MKLIIAGGMSKLGGYLSTNLNHEKWLSGRHNGFDLMDPKCGQHLIDTAREWGGWGILLNAYTHADPFAQGRCFVDLMEHSPPSWTIMVVGSFAHHFPPPGSLVPGQMAYRAGKKYLHDIFVRYSTTQGRPRMLLLEPGTIRYQDWPVPEGAHKTNYLHPQEIVDAIDVFLGMPQFHHACWSIRGKNFP